MNHSSSDLRPLGDTLRQARESKSLSIRNVADSTGIGRSTLLDLEQGKVASPNPTSLARLASLLETELSDLYALAGYTPPNGLPAFSPYLRNKYGDLPAAAQAELARSFEHISEKYGYDPRGPAPGQDE